MKYKKGDFAIIPNIRALDGEAAATRSIYMALCGFANEEGECYPSQSKIAHVAGVSQRMVRIVINRLVTLGILTRAARFNGKERGTNLYHITIPEGGGEAPYAGGEAPYAYRTISPELYRMHVPLSGDGPLSTSISEGSGSRMVKSKTMGKIRGYDENNPGEYTPTVDADTGAVAEKPKEKNLRESYKELLGWAEKREGRKFANPLRQYAAMKLMRNAGIGSEDVKIRWAELSGDPFYEKAGLDFWSVANSFDKRKP